MLDLGSFENFNPCKIKDLHRHDFCSISSARLTFVYLSKQSLSSASESGCDYMVLSFRKKMSYSTNC